MVSSRSLPNFPIMDKASFESVEDALPPYSNTLHLLTLCQRKKEFNAALDKARRRNWEVIWLLLDGTALRIYSPTKEERRRFEDDRIGYGHTSAVPKRIEGLRGEEVLPRPFTSSSSLSISIAPPAPTPPSSATSKRTPGQVKPNPDLSTRTPLRQYPVRNAVCMRPDSYFKRDHVLRFILEDGKQFLVQLNSRSEVISWLQYMSMAAPLALDIDERPMPEPAQYPRARRRPATAPAPLETAASITPSPPVAGPPLTSASLVCIPLTLRSSEEDVSDDEAHMDHLPPPRRPPTLRSLSSVEQARRMGIQL